VGAVQLVDTLPRTHGLVRHQLPARTKPTFAVGVERVDEWLFTPSSSRSTSSTGVHFRQQIVLAGVGGGIFIDGVERTLLQLLISPVTADVATATATRPRPRPRTRPRPRPCPRPRPRPRPRPWPSPATSPTVVTGDRRQNPGRHPDGRVVSVPPHPARAGFGLACDTPSTSAVAHVSGWRCLAQSSPLILHANACTRTPCTRPSALDPGMATPRRARHATLKYPRAPARALLEKRQAQTAERKQDGLQTAGITRSEPQ